MRKSIISILSVAVTLPALAASPVTMPATTQSASDDSGLVIAYDGDPPSAGIVTTRLEAEGGRCISDPSIIEFVLCTGCTGLTTSARPKLAWYLNKPLTLPVKVILTDPNKHQTMHLWQSTGTVAAGIHVLDMSRGNTELQPGVEYKWTVRIVNDASDPSKDMYSSGTIRRIDSSDPDAANHAFYDAMGNVVDKMQNPDENARASIGFKRLSQLANLPAIQNTTVTVDSAQ